MSLDRARALYEKELAAREKESCKASFYTFFTKAWHVVDPAVFLPNWHHGMICDHLEAVYRGEIRDLCINVPPGCTKSKLVSVLWQPWIWTQEPKFKMLSTSYVHRLAARDAAASKTLVRSEWYERRWGPILRGKGADSLYFTLAGGLRFAAGIGTGVTGWHFDALTIDDPTDPLTFNLESFEKTVEWKRATLSTRRIDPNKFRTVLIQQRLHDLDLAGYFMEKEGAAPLILPMHRTYSTPKPPRGEDPRKEGELLWPERYSPSEVKRMEEITLGPNNAAAQFEQDPVPAGGNIFTEADCSHTYDTPPAKNKSVCVISCDFSVKDKDSNDYVSMQVWYSSWPRFYLVHETHARMAFWDSVSALRQLIALYPECTTILIEDKANGSPIIETLKNEVPGIVPLLPETLGGDKTARANAVQGLFRSGSVLVPKDAPWLTAWRKEMMRFPLAPNDDSVDATTQALIWLKANFGLVATKGKWGALGA